MFQAVDPESQAVLGYYFERDVFDAPLPKPLMYLGFKHWGINHHRWYPATFTSEEHLACSLETFGWERSASSFRLEPLGSSDE